MKEPNKDPLENHLPSAKGRVNEKEKTEPTIEWNITEWKLKEVQGIAW